VLALNLLPPLAATAAALWYFKQMEAGEPGRRAIEETSNA
jgi:hypothetical protein